MIKQNVELAKEKLNNHLRAGEESKMSVFEVASLMDQINFGSDKSAQLNQLLSTISLN